MSDYIDRMLKKVEELWWEPTDKPPAGVEPISEYAIGHDTFDSITWKGLLDTSKAVREVTDSFIEQFDVPGERAFEDLFNLLYKSDPRMTGSGEMLPEYKGNHRLLQEFTESEEVKRLREFTTLDDYQAGFAALEMEQAFRDALERVREAEEERQAAQDAAEQAQQEMQQAAQDAQAGAGGPNEQQLGQDLQEKMDAAGQAQQQAQQAQEKAEATQKSAGQDLQHAAQAAGQEMKDANARCSTYGFGPGELKYMDFDERRTLSKQLGAGKVKRFMDLVGHWKLKSQAMRRQKVKHEPGEVFDYELGNDLTRLAPTERDNMAIPELEDLFLLKFANHELLLEVQHGTERTGQGPIIVTCDESTSMTKRLDLKGNTREAWSKALTLALAGQARKEKRDFTYIGFNAQVAYEITFHEGKISMRELIEFVEHFAGGGTNFMPPLQRAFSQIEDAERAGRAKADIVFITDGDGRIDTGFGEQFRTALARQGGACYAIQVGDDLGTGKPAPALTEITDKVMFIDALNADPEGVGQLFRNI